MDPLTLAAACAIGLRSPLFLVPPSCATPPALTENHGLAEADPWAPMVREAARRFAVPERWVRSVMQAESAGIASARSPKGAIGLMQIMPETYAELRARYGLGADPYSPRDNILAGTAYIRELAERYGAPGFAAAYNAGPSRFDAYRTQGKPLPEETRRYVSTIAEAVSDAPEKADLPPLLREIRRLDAERRQSSVPPRDRSDDTLFVPLTGARRRR